MSSPKSAGPRSSSQRTAREALSRAAKAASRPHADDQPQQPAHRASARAKEIAGAIANGVADGRLDVLSTEALQALLAAACRLYAARSAAGEQFAPVARNTVSATDVMITTSGLLRAADIAAFELGMWQGVTGR
jgi:hypothetical protein